MKKIIFSLVVLSLLIQFPVFAAETTTEETPGVLSPSAGRPVETPGASMNQPAGMPAPGARMGNPVQNQLVSTNDGGVIILMGPRILKYDADLKLVKEAWVPFPKFSPSKKEPTPVAAKADQPVVAESQEKAI